ncbi:MAG: type VII toxin-antitoxin system HepT family RNase toxin [bacterium]
MGKRKMERELKERIIKHLRFLEEEVEDYSIFKGLTWEMFNKDRNKRRNVERWVENIISSTIDIAKLILSLEGLKLGETYREMILRLSLVEGFPREDIQELARWVPLRNIIAHEYLDIRWSSIRRFIAESEQAYKRFISEVKAYLKGKF